MVRRVVGVVIILAITHLRLISCRSVGFDAAENMFFVRPDGSTQWEDPGWLPPPGAAVSGYSGATFIQR
jgi:hypothetical protein